MHTPLISLRHVTFAPNHHAIVDNVSCTFDKDKITTIIGPNGSGKTTLVKLILGIEQPTKGIIKEKKGLKIGYMPQKIQIDPSMPLTVKRFLQNKNALDKVNGRALLHLDMSTLSGGEMQRVLLAYALQNEPDILILDEPAQGLDMTGEKLLYELILSYQKEKKCGVILVSHDLNFVMEQTDEVICLNRHICCQGKPEHIQGSPCYQTLFGKVPYTHHHDHVHDLQGKVCPCHD